MAGASRPSALLLCSLQKALAPPQKNASCRSVGSPPTLSRSTQDTKPPGSCSTCSTVQPGPQQRPCLGLPPAAVTSRAGSNVTRRHTPGGCELPPGRRDQLLPCKFSSGSSGRESDPSRLPAAPGIPRSPRHARGAASGGNRQGLGWDHRGDWGGRDLKDHPGQPPVPHFSLDAGCGHCTKPAGRAGGAAPHASKPREMPRAAFLRVSSMERIRNKMQTEQVSQSLPPLVCTESWSCLVAGVSAGLLVSLAVSNPCQKIGIFSAVAGTAASDLLTPYPAASEMF